MQIFQLIAGFWPRRLDIDSSFYKEVMWDDKLQHKFSWCCTGSKWPTLEFQPCSSCPSRRQTISHHTPWNEGLVPPWSRSVTLWGEESTGPLQVAAQGTFKSVLLNKNYWQVKSELFLQRKAWLKNVLSHLQPETLQSILLPLEARLVLGTKLAVHPEGKPHITPHHN